MELPLDSTGRTLNSANTAAAGAHASRPGWAEMVCGLIAYVLAFGVV